MTQHGGTVPHRSRGRGEGRKDRRRADPRKESARVDVLTLDPPRLHRRVLEGLPYEPLRQLQETLDLTIEELATLLQIPARTLARRKRSGRLEPDESDRLVRAALLFDRAVSLFEGDREAARRWFLAPHPGLGGNTPFEFSRTDVGAREVEMMIGRLEHGVVS